MLGKLKRTIEGVVLASAISLAPSSAKAMTEQEFMEYAPPHMQWIVQNKTQAAVMVLGANVIFNCFKSGIGSKFNGDGFWEGCGKGAFGGAVSFAGEYIATYNDYPGVGAAGKLVNDLGISMSDNVMRGESMLSQYQTDLGPLTLTFRDGVVPHPSFTITPAVGLVKAFADKRTFDWKASLSNLTPIFRIDNFYYDGDSSSGDMVLGFTQGNVVNYSRWPGTGNLILSHEFNHSLFFSKLRFTNDLLTIAPESLRRWWNIGQDFSCLAFGALDLSLDTYYFNPVELEGFMMQRR